MLTHPSVGDAIGREGLSKLLETQFILAGNSCHGLIQLCIANPYSGTASHLELETLNNKALNNLFGQNVVAWQAARVGSLRSYCFSPLSDFRARDDVVVNNRCDLIEHNRQAQRRQTDQAQA